MTLFEVEIMTAVEHNSKPQGHKITMFIGVSCLSMLLYSLSIITYMVIK